MELGGFAMRAIFWGLVAGLWAVIAAPGLAAGAPSDAGSALVVAPATLTASRFDGAAPWRAIVIAHTSAAGAPEARLVATSSPGLTVGIGSKVVGAGDPYWPVTIGVTSAAPDVSNVEFRLTGIGSDTASPARGVLEVKVGPGRYASPVDDAELSVKTDFTSITELASAKAYLLIRNKSDYPFRVEALQVDSPRFLSVRLGARYGVVPAGTDLRVKAAVAANVGPHETLRIPLDIAVGTPRIGEWLLLANVTLARGAGGLDPRGVAVVDQKVTVGVPGVSEVLKVLDLPSLLIVPGALILATWSILLGGAAATQPAWLQWKSSSFWVVAISLSILVFAALNLFHRGSDFLVAFGLGNVARLWFGSVLFAFVAFQARRGALEWTRRRREPLETDKPIDILRKLARANLPFYLNSYEHPAGGQTQPIYNLGFTRQDDKAWAIPRMLLSPLTSNGDVADPTVAIMAANDDKNGLPRLIALLDAAIERRVVKLCWEAGAIGKPQLLVADSLGAAGPLESPVSLE